MYGYRTKHKILTEYLNRLKKDSPKDGDLNITHTVLMKQFAIDIGKKEPRSGYVMQQMSNLTIEGYLHVTQNKEKNDMNMSITPKGINAVMSETFKIKQNEWLWKAIMNTTMTLANMAVAITAIWALTKKNVESQRIEERLNKLEKGQAIQQVKPNPNISHLPDSSQSNTKDSLQENSK